MKPADPPNVLRGIVDDQRADTLEPGQEFASGHSP